MMHFANPWPVIALLALGCMLAMLRLRRIEQSGSLARGAVQPQQRLHCLVLALCAAMLLLLPLVDAPYPPLQVTASRAQ